MRLIALLAGLIASSSVAQDAFAAGCRDRTPTSWDVQAAPDSEPGERLVITGRVLGYGAGAAGRSPLTGITVYAYHADAKGDYQRKGHEKEPPRLCGILITNAKGEYRIRTSMPGGYEGYLPHIHFEIWGPHVPRQFAFVNLRRESGAMDTVLAVMPGSDPPLREDRTGMTRPVRRGANGVLTCSRDLVVEVKEFRLLPGDVK